MKRIPLIIDCNPGTDDAVALSLALFSEDLDIKLITTVAGNVAIEDATQNTLHLLDVFNKNIPVGKGSSRPLIKRPTKPTNTEGLASLGSYVYDNTFTNKHISGDAVSLMYKTLKTSKEKINFIMFGPLTNLANLLTDYHDVKQYIDTVYVMGGSIGGINGYMQGKEFGFYYDPHAAQLVLNSGLNIRIIPMEVGLSWCLSVKDIDTLAKVNRTGELFKEILKPENREYSYIDRACLFDSTTLLYMLNPELFVAYDARCKVELEDKNQLGLLSCDFNSTKPNCKVVSEVNEEKIKKLFVQLTKQCATQTEQTRPIMIDCDPGVDDAMAIMNALYSPQVRTLLITTVGGNTTSDITANNALHIIELCHRKTPVAMGASAPLCRKAKYAKHAHGENGLGGYTYKQLHSKPLNEDAVDAMYRTLLEHKKQHVTLLSLGPMTNVATLLHKYPDCRNYIRKIVFMGGTKEHFLSQPYNEFNVSFDPEATSMVIDSGIPLVMVPMEMGHMAYLDHEEIKYIKHTNKTGKILAKMFEKYHDTHVNVYGAATHDSCTLLYLTHPEYFKTEKAKITVKEYNEDNIYIDVQYGDKNANALVCVDMDINKFKQDFFNNLQKMD